MMVPGNWENHGYRDYDGYAWYRTTFKVSNINPNEELLLLMGKIDDFDHTYLNGEMIGSTGTIKNDPRLIKTGHEWSKFRVYDIPQGTLKTNSINTIAVRVYDGLWGGGIYEGPVGIISKSEYLRYIEKYKKKSK